jgi:hypothetical protein
MFSIWIFCRNAQTHSILLYQLWIWWVYLCIVLHRICINHMISTPDNISLWLGLFKKLSRLSKMQCSSTTFRENRNVGKLAFVFTWHGFFHGFLCTISDISSRTDSINSCALFWKHIHVLNNLLYHGRRASQKVPFRDLAWCMGVLSFPFNNILLSLHHSGLSTRGAAMCHYYGNCSTFDDKQLLDTVFALSFYSSLRQARQGRYLINMECVYFGIVLSYLNSFLHSRVHSFLHPKVKFKAM